MFPDEAAESTKELTDVLIECKFVLPFIDKELCTDKLWT